MSNLKIALACGIASIGFFSPACAAAQERNFDGNRVLKAALREAALRC